MTEQELRELVRAVVAERLGQRSSRPAPALAEFPPASGTPAAVVETTTHAVTMHSSHSRFQLPADPEGRCLIESAVPCNHCGFCQSYGH